MIPLPSLPVPQRPRTIEIIDAQYGVHQPSIVCSAAILATRLCNGRAWCEMPVADTDCSTGQQPPSVLIATLTVTYRCFAADKPRSVSQTRPFTLRISCLSGH